MSKFTQKNKNKTFIMWLLWLYIFPHSAIGIKVLLYYCMSLSQIYYIYLQDFLPRYTAVFNNIYDISFLLSLSWYISHSLCAWMKRSMCHCLCLWLIIGVCFLFLMVWFCLQIPQQCVGHNDWGPGFQR